MPLPSGMTWRPKEVDMGFPDSVLTSDEQVVRHLHPHWKTLVAPVFWLLALASGMVGAWMLLSDSDSRPKAVILLVLGVIAVIGIIVLSVWPWLCWYTNHYVFTNERVIVRTGVISRTGRDIPLSRVNDISFSHGIVDRMLGCGTLTIESAGERGQIVLVAIPGVEKVQSLLYGLVEADRDQHSFDDRDREVITRGRPGDDPQGGRRR
jgi:uncharacterized membrane protein YdbT with pleckstrin-like domain